jgi:V8-like Glu-specific endopeptidase
MKNLILLRIAALIIAVVTALAAAPATHADGPGEAPNGDELHTAVASDGSPTVYVTPVDTVAKVEDGQAAEPDPLAREVHDSDVETAPQGADANQYSLNSYVDGRTRVSPPTQFPYTAIAHLEVRFQGLSTTCTGFFIGPHTVATTGSCVYSHYFGGWARSVRVTPGRDELSSYGSQHGIRFVSVRGWTRDGDRRYDYGAVILPNDDLGNRVGWFGFTSLSNGQLDGLPVNWAGYPSDKIYGTQWRNSGEIWRVIARQVFGMDPLNGGPAGAPWWRSQDRGPYAVAIRSFYDEPNCWVRGGEERCAAGVRVAGATRITRPVLDNLRAWKQ